MNLGLWGRGASLGIREVMGGDGELAGEHFLD